MAVLEIRRFASWNPAEDGQARRRRIRVGFVAGIGNLLPSPISHIGSQKTHIGSQKTGAPEGEDAYRKKNQRDKESTRPCRGGRHDKAAAVAMTKETARPPPKIGQNTSSYGLESTMKTDSFRGKSTVERTWVARRPFKAPAGIRTPPCVWAS